MHTLTLKRVLGFTIVILLLLALFIWGIGLETLKARQVDLLYLGQRHLMLVFTSMFCFTGRYPEWDFTQPTCGKRIC